MDRDIMEILKSLEQGAIDINSAFNKITEADASSGKEVRLDDSREERCGFQEYIYGASKTALQIKNIINTLFTKKRVVLVSRVTQDAYEQVKDGIPNEVAYDSLARMIYHFPFKKEKTVENKLDHKVLVVTAGTSDIPVALEAKYTVEASGFACELICDVGVAGIHRLFNKINEIRSADVLIVVAGMEGALPSVIGGLVSIPVIAVPTSVGYGTSFSGATALLGMLNSCANGISVMNIDNGFGAGCAAVRILNVLKKKRTS